MKKENGENNLTKEEEKRKQRLFEIEKKLGRHNKDKEIKNKRNNKIMNTLLLQQIWFIFFPCRS